MHSIHGLKILILDKLTTPIISLNYLQSEAFEQEVFVFETIEKINHEKAGFMSAVYMITAP